MIILFFEVALFNLLLSHRPSTTPFASPAIPSPGRRAYVHCINGIRFES